MPVSVEIRSCLNGDAGPDVQHRRQKVSPVLFSLSLLPQVQLGQVSPLWMCRPFRSYKVRFNSVSSHSDTRKSSSDEPDAKINFESTGPLANVRLTNSHFFFGGLNFKPYLVCQGFLASIAIWGWQILSDSLLIWQSTKGDEKTNLTRADWFTAKQRKMTYPLQQEHLHSSKTRRCIYSEIRLLDFHFLRQKEERAADVGKAVSMFGLWLLLSLHPFPHLCVSV